MFSKSCDEAEPRPRPGLGRSLGELLYRLRTEADTPARQALSVALGVLVGCLPLFGLHLALCLLLGRLLRLSRVTMYLAANLNNPLLAPFLVYLQIQVGSLLLGGRLYPLTWEALAEARLLECLGELAVGSVAVGAVLGALAGLAAFRLLRLRPPDRYRELLVERAARPYLDSGYLHWEFVRGKLRHDGVYLRLLASGVLPASGRLLDLGCGRGILLRAIAVAAEPDLAGQRPPGWAEPPAGLELVGVEGRRRTVAVAQRALAGFATVSCGDLRQVELPRATAVVLLDVLHYLEPAEQDRLLARARAALAPGGVLLVREADAGRSWRFGLTALAERLRALGRGHGGQRFAFRPRAAWEEALAGLGLEVRVETASGGRVFANVLLVARAPAE